MLITTIRSDLASLACLKGWAARFQLVSFTSWWRDPLHSGGFLGSSPAENGNFLMVRWGLTDLPVDLLGAYHCTPFLFEETHDMIVSIAGCWRFRPWKGTQPWPIPHMFRVGMLQPCSTGRLATCSLDCTCPWSSTRSGGHANGLVVDWGVQCDKPPQHGGWWVPTCQQIPSVSSDTSSVMMGVLTVARIPWAEISWGPGQLSARHRRIMSMRS